MNQERIGKFIAKLRKEKGLTQEQLAEKLKVSTNAVSKWERGICLMDISLLIPLSKILNVSVGDILNGDKITKEQEPTLTSKILTETVSYSSRELEKVRKKIPLFIIIIIFLICAFSSTLIYFNLTTKNNPLEIKDNESLLILNLASNTITNLSTKNKVDIYVSSSNLSKKVLIKNALVYKVTPNASKTTVAVIIPKEQYLNLSKLSLISNITFSLTKTNSKEEISLDTNLIQNLLDQYLKEVPNETN